VPKKTAGEPVKPTPAALRPTPYPKQATVLAQPGWETIVDASRAEIDKWLEQRKKARHSVVWLDSCQVGDRPVFSATAALDDREPNWIAMLDETPFGFGDGIGAIAKKLNPNEYRVVSVSGYSEESQTRIVLLWVPGRTRWNIHPEEMPEEKCREFIKRFAAQGFVCRVLRPYPIFKNVLRYAIFLEVSTDACRHILAADAKDLATFSAAARSSKERIAGLVAYPRENAVAFAAVTVPNVSGWEWETDTDLTALELPAKVGEAAKRSFHPTVVSAYAWDGAVRYCVVWVKEPKAKP
jgi:hypothetical protein